MYTHTPKKKSEAQCRCSLPFDGSPKSSQAVAAPSANPLVLLFSMTQYGHGIMRYVFHGICIMGYVFGQFESAVLVSLPTSSLCTLSLLSGRAM